MPEEVITISENLCVILHQFDEMLTIRDSVGGETIVTYEDLEDLLYALESAFEELLDDS